MKKYIKPLASLKLAVIIILLLSVLVAVGTIVEARFDATAAAKLVYKTPWMMGVMLLLVVNLSAVMVDRWPWKARHAPFVLAHIGIMILLLGSYITMKWGLDGSMRVAVNESNRFVQGPQTDLVIYSSFDGSGYAKLFEKEVDYFLRPPSKEPVKVQVEGGEIQILDYEPYMLASKKITASSMAKAGAGVRFQISNANVNMNDWLVQRKEKEVQSKKLGLAQFVIVDEFPKNPTNENQFYIRPRDEKSVEYRISYKDSRQPAKKGVLSEGQSVQTGWMGLEFKLLRYLPKAEEKWEFEKADRPSQMTTAAIKVAFQGKEHWLQQDDILKLFTEKAVYIVAYSTRQIDVGFSLFLKEFEINRYPGSMMASNYKSRVSIENGVSDAMISMNEPLKYQGLTLYQASFQENDEGKPIASIFSVNYDPGRWIKYFGSFLITLGTVLLFYFKRKTARAMAPKNEAVEVFS